MASTKGQPWDRAVQQPAFEVAPQLPSGTGTPQSAAACKNMQACSTCAGMRKKCNMSPPYSYGNCESCAKARVVCPPHNERRPRRRGTQAGVAQHSPLSESASDALQSPFPSGNEVAEVIEPQTNCAIVAPATNVVAGTSNDDAAADAPVSHIGGFDGPVTANEWSGIPATNFVAETTAADAPANHIGGFVSPFIADGLFGFPVANFVAETAAADAPAGQIGGFDDPVTADELFDYFSLFGPEMGDPFA